VAICLLKPEKMNSVLPGSYILLPPPLLPLPLLPLLPLLLLLLLLPCVI